MKGNFDMETILGGNWYDAHEIARILQIPLSEAEEIIEKCKQDGRVPISHYADAEHPAINGYTLRKIAGQRQPTPYPLRFR